MKRNGILSLAGAKRKWRYLSLVYGLTVFINLFLFLVVFPSRANFNRADKKILSLTSQIETLVLQVEVPCSGHAPLVTEELKKVEGIEGIEFRLPNIFRISYDRQKITDDKIMSQEIFKNFKASKI